MDGEYVELVHQVEAKLLAAVRKNLRGRLFANPVKTVFMAWPSYSRSDRIGDLYDRHLYKRIWKEGPNERRPRKWNGAGPETQIAMHELDIHPKVPVKARATDSGSTPPRSTPATTGASGRAAWGSRSPRPTTSARW